MLKWLPFGKGDEKRDATLTLNGEFSTFSTVFWCITHTSKFQVGSHSDLFFCLSAKVNLSYRGSGVLTSRCTCSRIFSVLVSPAKPAVQHQGEQIIGFKKCHLISSQMLKNSRKILVLYPGFHFLVENHIKLSFLWNMENSTCSTCVMLLQKREIPDPVYRDRQLVCSALARADQPTLK